MVAGPPDAVLRSRPCAIVAAGVDCAAEISGPGMLWNAALNCVSKGSGYEPCSLTCVKNFGAISQNRWLGAELAAAAEVALPLTPAEMMFDRGTQLLISERPVLSPPCSSTPLRSRVLTVRSTPLYTSVAPVACTTTRFAGVRTLAGWMSTRPHIGWPLL